MNRCPTCTCTLNFYGISVQRRGFDDNGDLMINWTRWANCPNCGLFSSYDPNGTLKGTQKQEPPQTLFMGLKG